jgi:two-component system C4-dicarboxylate transport sensor histidine kinase DctB
MTGLLRRHRLSIYLALVIVAALAAFVFIRITTNAVRAEARHRFFEQFNRQQYLMAEMAAHKLEEKFATIHRNLDLVVSLFEEQDVTPQRAQEVKGTLKKIHGVLANTPVIDLTVFDSHGIAVATEPYDSYTIGRSYAWRDYYRWARKEKLAGHMYVSPFMRLEGGRYRGDKALIVAEGIYGAHEKFLGVVIFSLNFDDLVRREITPIHLGRYGKAWLVDNNNRTLLVDPNGKMAGLSFEEAFLPKWPELYRLLLSTDDGKPGSGAYWFEDPQDNGRQIRKLGSHYPVRIENRLWTLGVSSPEREAEAQLSAFLQRQENFAVTLLVTILAGGVLAVGVLSNWNRILTGQVARHTRDLNEARNRLESTFDELLVTKKIAAVGRLALGLVHEIRNPLSAIQMNMQMIRKKIKPDGALRENFSIAEGEIRRLNRLLTDVQDFARSRPLRLQEADLGGIVVGLLKLLGHRLEEQQIRSDLKIESPLLLICDQEQIHQVLLNLLLNAMEAMQENAGERVLGIESCSRDGMALIRVSDTGAGIAAEKREQLFDPFFTTKAAGGGLGLSILQTIVMRHGGLVTVDSEPGLGAAFTVTLPLKGPPQQEHIAL